MIKRIVVAGCRDYNNYEEAKEFIENCIRDIKSKHTLVFVSGFCRGADMLGERYARENGYDIERYPADWKRYGKGAGIVRNREMATVGDLIICFWDKKSKGTKALIDFANKLNKPLEIYCF